MKPGQYPFDLSNSEEARARRLHQDSIVFDWMSMDIGGPNIFDYYPEDMHQEMRQQLAEAGQGFGAFRLAAAWPYEIALAGRSQLVRDWFFESGMTCGTYSVPVYEGSHPEWDVYDKIAKRNDELPWLRRVTTAAGVRQAKKDGVIALYGHWQPAIPLPRNLKAIDEAYGRGLRSLMLTYNRMDNVGVGCTERVDAGLSMFGVDVVRHCENTGIMVDVSHCGHETTMDACRIAKRSVNANHTCAKALSNVARAKSDEALKAVANTGGVVGVLVVPFFISRAPTPTVEIFLDHIDYIANLIGREHVSIGSDWPYQTPRGMLGKLLQKSLPEIGFRPEDRVNTEDYVVGFEDYRDLVNVTRGLVKRGYSDEQIRGILGENALRVFAEVCG